MMILISTTFNLTRDIEKDRMTLHNETIKAISTLMDAYGIGDGSTTFNLPDLRGRMPMGLDNMGGSSANCGAIFFGQDSSDKLQLSVYGII